MTVQHLQLLRQARNTANYVRKHLDSDLQKGEITQREVELVTSNLCEALTHLQYAIKVLRDGPGKPKVED
jgi:hypothetical protein